MRFELEASRFGETEHEVHVLHGLSDGTFEKIVDAADHEELILVTLHIDHGFIGARDLLEVGAMADKMGEWCIGIVEGISLLHLFERTRAVGIGGDEDASRETASLGDEEQAAIVAGMEFLDGLTDLVKVLMGEGFIDGDIVVAPTEMRRSTRFLAGSRAARYAVDVDVAIDEATLQSRKECQLNGGGEAAGIGKVAGSADALAVGLGQTIDVVVIATKAEVLSEVDDADVVGDGVLTEEGFALAVAEAEEEDVDVGKGHGGSEAEIGVADEAFVNIADKIASIRLAVGENDGDSGMVDEQTDEFATGVARCAEDSYFNVLHRDEQDSRHEVPWMKL